MRCLYLVDEYPPFFRGGLGTYASEITPLLAELGLEPTVISRNRGGDPEGECLDGIEVHRPPLFDACDLFDLLAESDLAASTAISGLVRADGRPFDLVAAHDWLASLAGMMVVRNLDLPFVFHIHSTEQGRQGGKGSAVRQTIERMAAVQADLVVTVSYAMRDELIRLRYDGSSARVVYNGVDPAKYDPSAVPPEEVAAPRARLGVADRLLLIFIGRLEWVKGVEPLLLAMPSIVQAVPDVRLVLVGVGELEAQARDLIRQGGLEEHVVPAFRVLPEPERILHCAAADLYVFPSRYEPFGIVCTQAMAMGRPVVVGASNTSGFREHVVPHGPGRCGAYVDPGDPFTIASAVIELLRDREGLARLGQNGRERVLRQFTWAHAADRTLSAYSDAVSLRRPCAGTHNAISGAGP